MGLPLHFIKNTTTGAWIGLVGGQIGQGVEEGDFEDALPFTSLGSALGVHEHLTRQARRVGKRLSGFVCRQVPDAYEIVSLTLGEPSERDDDTEVVGEMVEGPDDEDEFEDDDIEDGSAKSPLMRAVDRRLKQFPGPRWSRIWAPEPQQKEAA